MVAILFNLNTKERQESMKHVPHSLLSSRAQTTSLKCQPSLCEEEERKLPHLEMFQPPKVAKLCPNLVAIHTLL